VKQAKGNAERDVRTNTMETGSSVEAARLSALFDLQIIDTFPETVYQELVTLAAKLCATPTSGISLLDGQRQWFKASVGLDLLETPREIAFCDYTIRSDDIFQVADASMDARFAHNPLVEGRPHFQFYAGAPLILSDGIRLGSLFVMDHVPRMLSPDQKHTLTILAKQVVSQFELSHKVRQLQSSTQKLREQKFLLDGVADNFPGALFRTVLTHENRFELLYLSDGAGKIFNVDTAVLRAHQELARSVVHYQDLAGLEAKIAISAAELTDFRWEGRVSTREREAGQKWLRVVASPHRTSAGIAWDGFFVDITYEKSLEQNIIKEKRLSVQAMKAAAFGKLANGLAHEINNPLAIIKGMCFVIGKRTKADALDVETLDGMLTTIVDNVSRISKILGFVDKLSVSSKNSQLQSTTAKNIMDSALFLANDLIKSTRVRIEVHLEIDVVISCRLSSIARALANLIINSCEAVFKTEDAWIKLEVEADREAASVSFRVTDSGAGIVDERLPFIMDPFYTTKNIGEGNGLGLAISKAILEDHEGSLRYELQSGHTSFVMELPTKAENKALFI